MRRILGALASYSSDDEHDNAIVFGIATTKAAIQWTEPYRHSCNLGWSHGLGENEIYSIFELRVLFSKIREESCPLDATGNRMKRWIIWLVQSHPPLFWAHIVLRSPRLIPNVVNHFLHERLRQGTFILIVIPTHGHENHIFQSSPGVISLFVSKLMLSYKKKHWSVHL